MEPQTLQSKTLDPAQLQKLEEEIEQEMVEILKSSKIRTLLQQYGIACENVIKIQLQCDIELAHSQSDSGVDEKSVQTFLTGIRPPNVLKLKCCEDWQGNCIKC
ncbi:hypothetical protein [Aulosira sp. FACHB-615]|uniref:hypothetical protein n=1 Tax=Aulosira sp. FACHB-615 TaxID=2692777 RepID=UPI001687D0ED|nr:hypothetical protein [Aulosira sp. FACHB-615]MBD2486307.1 hypothetical protein [Aulosira sp. FACHB-615]